MRDYYKVIEIAENVYQLYEPAGVGSTLVIGSEKAMLIDTGYGFKDIKPVVESLTDLPVVVVNTHGHPDHTNGNCFFEQAWINPIDIEIDDEYRIIQRPLIAAQLEGLRKAAGKPNIWPEDFDRLAWYYAETKEFLWLADGQIFELGEDHKIEVIFMPGHTTGSVVFFDWKTHILYSGDAVDYSFWTHFKESMPLSLCAYYLERLKKYPIEHILPAHKKQLLSAWLIDALPKAIRSVTIEGSRQFFHPRTGDPGLLFKAQLNGTSPDGFETIFITYRPDRM